MSEKEFNLLDEKWILAMDGDGRIGGYSLCDIFDEAHGWENENESPGACVLKCGPGTWYGCCSIVRESDFISGRRFLPHG